jgi:hypothetical protein
MQAFFIRSVGSKFCPCCLGELTVKGSRPRVWYQSSGERSKLIIRRLYCETCKKIHHELPDFLVPYKRYDAESIEGIVSVPARTDIAADGSTLARWRSWFLAWAVYAEGCLQSISIRFNQPVDGLSKGSQTALHSLGRYVGLADGWLSRIVHSIVNSLLW